MARAFGQKAYRVSSHFARLNAVAMFPTLLTRLPRTELLCVPSDQHPWRRVSRNAFYKRMQCSLTRRQPSSIFPAWRSTSTVSVLAKSIAANPGYQF